MYDVVIVGAGPAGLSAALLLGRCRRRVLLCDAGQPRNAAATALHCFLTRDGITPTEFLQFGRAQLQPYTSVEVRDGLVVAIQKTADDFCIQLKGRRHVSARMVLLATGVVDTLPPVPGIHHFYGRSVFHCPYCDGWEVRDQPLAVYGNGSGGVGLARTLLGWTSDLLLCTDGSSDWSRQDQKRLDQWGVPVFSERIARLEGSDGQLEQIVFADGQVVPRRALFFHTGQGQRSDLATRLGCRVNSKGSVKCNEDGLTTVPGVYVAGDASHDVQLAVIAAAEGAKAAFAINKALLEEQVTATARNRSRELLRSSLGD
jgi:thioredoxin reductase